MAGATRPGGGWLPPWTTWRPARCTRAWGSPTRSRGPTTPDRCSTSGSCELTRRGHHPQDPVVALPRRSSPVAVVGEHVQRPVGTLHRGAQAAELAFEQGLVAGHPRTLEAHAAQLLAHQRPEDEVARPL